MAHTYGKLLYHCVFSTKERRPTIRPDWRERLYRYLSGILTQSQGHLVRAGGTADHVHLLLELEPSADVADAMRLIKTNSSKWAHDTFPNAGGFGWQSGYGAFSVSKSNTDAIVEYIDRQEEHHHKLTFAEEDAPHGLRRGLACSAPPGLAQGRSVYPPRLARLARCEHGPLRPPSLTEPEASVPPI